MSYDDVRKEMLRIYGELEYGSRSISEATPGTFVSIDKEKNLLLAERHVEATENISCGGWSRVLNFSENFSHPQLTCAYVAFDSIYYVDNEKKLHDCMSFHLFFSTKSLAHNFVSSLPSCIHVYSNSERYNQVSFFKRGNIEVYLLTKTREEYIEILNRVFAYPEARPFANVLLECHYFGADRGVCAKDIHALKMPEMPLPETHYEKTATSGSALITESPLRLISSQPVDSGCSLSADNTTSGTSCDSNNHDEPVSESLLDKHRHEPTQTEYASHYERRLSGASNKSLLKNGVFSETYGYKSHPEPKEKESGCCVNCLIS